MPFNTFLSFKSSIDSAGTTYATFRTSLSTITESTIRLRDGISNWKGDKIGAASILNKAYRVISDIHSCADIYRQLEEWTREEEDEALLIMEKLVHLLAQSTEAAIIARPKFRKIYFIGDPVALSILQRLRNATAELISVLVRKTRKDRTVDAENLVKKAEGYFSKTIATFSSQFNEESNGLK
ncbi:hypothetical protein NLG97_g1738 [Lecanicillium saksenae]|uniref:Uncharacterized protein n=1 Tax=Lecanicillium saksenae TaxID=468837 RepID=A0ACC1R4S5_9HYPO|nr:hypothetical protein NLG97_g1738 [Lecanicillium saksenae]